MPSKLPSIVTISDVEFPELGLGKDIGKDKGKGRGQRVQDSVEGIVEVSRVGKGSGGVGVGVGVGVRACVSTRVGGQKHVAGSIKPLVRYVIWCCRNVFGAQCRSFGTRRVA